MAAEAKLREWLANTLPKKFGVTSGYVIPDLMAQGYPLTHFDVIIYDAMESPVLWIDSTEDMSESGKRRAIPARYVRAVYEIKATLTSAHAKDAMKKLATLNAFHDQLIMPCHTAVIFFELPSAHEKKNSLLSSFVPPVVGFTGGLILHCPVNDELSGAISLTPSPQDADIEQINRDHPVARDVDTMNIYLSSDMRSAVIADNGGEIMAVAWQGVWHMGRGYGCGWSDGTYHARFSWSRNAFAMFFLNMIAMLNGEDVMGPGRKGRTFGQTFDRLPKRVETPRA